MKNAIALRQYGKESLSTYYKRFMSTFEVAELHWGVLVPERLRDGIEANAVARGKFLACCFIAGVDQERYGSMIDQLNNGFLTGQKSYPVTVEHAMTMLSYCKDANDEVKPHSGMSNAQTKSTKHVKCIKWGKK